MSQSNHSIWASACFAIALCGFVSPVAVADEVSPEHVKFFENQVRPLLAEKCFECHGEDEQNADLRLDSLAAMLQGGESGAAIVPGEPGNSMIVAAINYESTEMPPDEKLSDEQIEVLTRWVSIGAPWPGTDSDAPVRKREQFDADDRSWWAIQPVAKPIVPNLQSDLPNWPRNEIDHFIADRMLSEGLTPAPEATKAELVRRLYVNVVGVPPTPAEVAAFIDDQSPDTYEKLVDRLLGSKGYGEHAARQWLDLVRYADSDGYRADGYRPNAWRYRDYVIDSLSEDKPYDRFVQEQLAADELFPDDLDASVGLGYLRHWVYEWNIRDARTQWKTILEDVTDTTADVFLGLGLQCAKCHNHKFDPLLQKDYLRLQAYLSPIMPRDVSIADGTQTETYQKQVAQWEEQTADVRAQIDAIELPYKETYRNIAIDRFPDDLKHIARMPAAERTPAEEQLAFLVQLQVEWEHEHLDNYIKGEDKEKMVALRRQLAEFKSIQPKPLPVAMTVSDVGVKAPVTLMPKRKDEFVEPGVPSILDPEPMVIEPPPSGLTTGRRAALAKWITDPSNPLSTRVIVNRIWQSHFGRGLAANPSDFGLLGGPPSHPELLDWLTTRFVEDGWSLKSLHRQILMSATYRQSTAHPRYAEFHQIDPANDFYWHRDTSRMSAEQIRDALLTVTGAMEECDGGPGQLADSTCRTVYTQVMRNSPDQLLEGFDLPPFFSSNSTRNTTTTPVQSLLMINSELMIAHARKLAASVAAQTSDLESQIGLAWERVFGRLPSDRERKDAIRFIQQQQTEIAASDSDVAAGRLATAKLPYRDGQGVKFDLDDSSLQLTVRHDPSMECDEFTIESFFQLRSIAQTGAVRTLASKWDGSYETMGWRFGVTGAGSRRKPRTLVMQMVGKKADGKVGESAIFSDQNIQINTPYYASATVRMPHDGSPGTVTFYLKDLSNDDEPLLVAELPHAITIGLTNSLPLTLGGISAKDRQSFDGLIDDVRYVGSPLGVDQILQTVERDVPNAIGYWQFETVPGVMRNSLGDRLNISGRGNAIVSLSPDEAALADFCHALLNSNEFLYVN